MQVIIIFFSKRLGIVKVDIKTTNSIAFGDMESNNTIFWKGEEIRYVTTIVTNIYRAIITYHGFKHTYHILDLIITPRGI